MSEVVKYLKITAETDIIESNWSEDYYSDPIITVAELNDEEIVNELLSKVKSNSSLFINLVSHLPFDLKINQDCMKVLLAFAPIREQLADLGYVKKEN